MNITIYTKGSCPNCVAAKQLLKSKGLDYEPPCKTGSQCTSKCQQCDEPHEQPHCNDCGGFDPECPLAQPAQQQEPVSGVVIREGLPTLLQDRDIKPTDSRLYTSPQPAQQEPAWRTPGGIPRFHPKPAHPSKPLTDEQIENLWQNTSPYYDHQDFARAIEAAHGITGETK